MTEAQIKEKYSRHFIGLLATKSGYHDFEPHHDFGVDLSIRKIGKVLSGNRVRYLLNAVSIDIQLKCTIEENLTITDESIFFDLSVKNFNDLIIRRDEMKQTGGMHIPLILILVVLKGNPNEWATFSPECDLAMLHARSFWFIPSEGEGISLNLSTQRIAIPLKNQLKLDFFDNLFNLLF